MYFRMIPVMLLIMAIIIYSFDKIIQIRRGANKLSYLYPMDHNCTEYLSKYDEGYIRQKVFF